MKNFIRLINRYVFNKFDEGYEYWININQIKVPRRLLKSKIGEEKYKRKWKHFRETGEFESKIIINSNFVLIDGYSSYVIAKKAELGKVPVYFVNSKKRGGENTR